MRDNEQNREKGQEEESQMNEFVIQPDVWYNISRLLVALYTWITFFYSLRARMCTLYLLLILLFTIFSSKMNVRAPSENVLFLLRYQFIATSPHGY